MTQFVEQLRNQAKWYAQPGHNARDLMDSHLLEKAADEIECLRAKIAEMEQQEPVMWANSSNINSSRINKERGGSGDQHTCSETQTAYHHAPLYALPGAQPSYLPSDLAEAIIADMQAQFDSELITENDSGEALIRLDGAIAAVEDNFAAATEAKL